MEGFKFEDSLQYMLKTFNALLQQAKSYNDLYTSVQSKPLNDLLNQWMHPKGLINLIKTLAQQVPTTASLSEQVRSQLEAEGPFLIEMGGTYQLQHIPQIAITKFQNPFDQKKQELPILSVAIFQESQEEDNSKQNQEEGQSDSSPQQSDDKLQKRGPYKSYSPEEKLRAVELLAQQTLSITEISKKLGIPCKNIKRWATDGIIRKRGAGRRRVNPRLEQEIFKWISNNYTLGQTISMDEIHQYALSRSKQPSFKASRGWALKFIERYRLRNSYTVA